MKRSVEMSTSLQLSMQAGTVLQVGKSNGQHLHDERDETMKQLTNEDKVKTIKGAM